MLTNDQGTPAVAVGVALEAAVAVGVAVAAAPVVAVNVLVAVAVAFGAEVRVNVAINVLLGVGLMTVGAEAVVATPIGVAEEAIAAAGCEGEDEGTICALAGGSTEVLACVDGGAESVKMAGDASVGVGRLSDPEVSDDAFVPIGGGVSVTEGASVNGAVAPVTFAIAGASGVIVFRGFGVSTATMGVTLSRATTATAVMAP